jgi:enoyl-[acyl-carrier protein] reductase I
MILKGKKALIMGLANDKSIAYGIAKSFKREGADIAISYAGESVKKRVMPIAQELGTELVFECDVSKDQDIENLANNIKEAWNNIDIVVHSIAYAPKDEFKNGVIDTTRSGFNIAMDISVYSFIAVVRAFSNIMNEEGAFLTLSYYGAQKVVPHYNVMGIAKAALESATRYLAFDIAKKNQRVNCISAGPIKTLSAYSITGFHLLMEHTVKVSPLGRHVTIEEVGDTAAFLCSEWARGITGQTIYVDSGYSIMGVSDKEEE